MNTREFWDLSGVSDELLLRDLMGFIGNGAHVEARIVAHLAEVEERRLHFRAAASSLFDYSVRRLGLSEGEAFHRITAARLARKFPVIFDLLAARSIHLSALRILRDHLTAENHRELLAAASNKSKKQVEALVAALAPRPDVAPLIRKLPATRRALSPTSSAVHVGERASDGAEAASISVSNTGRGPLLGDEREPAAARAASSSPEFAAGERGHGVVDIPARAGARLGDLVPGGGGAPSLSRPEPSARSGAPSSGSAAPGTGNRARMRAIEALSPDRYLLRLSVSRDFTDKLERARDLMSHANPSGELTSVLERALDLLLEKLEKQRFARTKRARVARKMPLERPSPERAEVVEEECGSLGGPFPDDHAGGAPKTRPARAAVSIARPRASERAERRLGEASPARRAQREHIPNEIRRAVAARDDFQCTYVDDTGHRCPSRAFLQIHHEQAHALGGPSTLENLRILCASHNRLLAELDFGRTHQEQIIRHKSDSNVA